MAFNPKELSSGIGGSGTFQMYTYTSSVDTKLTINNIGYWTSPDQGTVKGSNFVGTVFKTGDIIHFTSKAGGDNATECGVFFFTNI